MKRETVSNNAQGDSPDMAVSGDGHKSVKDIGMMFKEGGEREKPVVLLQNSFTACLHTCRELLAGLAEMKNIMKRILILLLFIPQWAFATQYDSGDKSVMVNDLYASAGTDSLPVRYGYESVEGVDIFYREAGEKGKPVIVLLHGFPASSHMYREVLAALAESFNRTRLSRLWTASLF